MDATKTGRLGEPWTSDGRSGAVAPRGPDGRSRGSLARRARSASPEAAALRRALLATSAAEPSLPVPARRFALALAAGLEGFASADAAEAAEAVEAVEAALAASGPGEAHGEAWGGVALSLSVREAMRAAGGARGDRDARFDALAALGARLAAACAGTSAERAGLAGAPPAHLAGVDALRAAKNRAAVGYAAAPFVATCFDEIARALPRLEVPGRASEALLRDAILRAEAEALRQGPEAFASAPAWARRALCRQVLAESAGALAEASAEALAGSAEARQGGARLARLGCRVLASMGEVEAWFPEPAAGEAGAPAPGAARGADCDGEVDRDDDNEDENKEEKMKDAAQTILKTLENDATDAAWRTAGSHFVKLARDPLAAVLSRHLGPGDAAARARLAAFLETEIGSALLASVLSMALSAMPQSTGEVPQRLARELRVKAMADVSDLVAEVVMGPLRQVMALHLQGDVARAPGTLASGPGLGRQAAGA